MPHTDHKIFFLFSATSSQNQEHISTMLALCQPPSSRYTWPFTSDQSPLLPTINILLRQK